MTASADDTPRYENDGKEAAGGESEDRRPHPSMKFANNSFQEGADELIRRRPNPSYEQSSVAGPPFGLPEAPQTVGMEHSDAPDSIKIAAGAQPSASTVSTSLASDAPETKPFEGVGPNVSDAKSAAISNALSFSREPSEAALRLNFEEYALAISRVFRDASGEFCMALLGRWGSGKTRLARLVTTYLSKPDVFSLELEQYGLPRADNDTMQYSIVWFSAWQYRRVPEAWIFLYETFSKP
jgi:KAP family P-loop domain